MFSNTNVEAKLLFLSVRKFLVQPVPGWKCWPRDLKTKIKNVLRTGLTNLWKSIVFISWSTNLQKYLPISLNVIYEGNQSFWNAPSVKCQLKYALWLWLDTGNITLFLNFPYGFKQSTLSDSKNNSLGGSSRATNLFWSVCSYFNEMDMVLACLPKLIWLTLLLEGIFRSHCVTLITARKLMLSIKDFFSKCDKIRRKL